MKVVVRAFNEVYYDGFAKEAILPGDDGELSIWDFHQMLITRLRKGSILLILENLKAKKINIESGIAKFHRNELIVLCSQTK